MFKWVVTLVLLRSWQLGANPLIREAGTARAVKECILNFIETSVIMVSGFDYRGMPMPR